MPLEDQLFPEALIRWAGHREGGVRLPFFSASGRPTGIQIETPLVARLKRWASDIVLKSGTPRIVLLVGGPGNGKTDAVEGCIGALDESLGAKDALVSLFEKQFKVDPESLPPRKVRVLTSNLHSNDSVWKFQAIDLVQDATESDPGSKLTSELLFLEDLNEALNLNKETIFLCCVNRGILANASRAASMHDRYKPVAPVLDLITECVTNKPNAPSCWPLHGHPEIAVWPMDVESLVDFDGSGVELSVAHQVFDVLLEDWRWKPGCELKTKCPFCQNRKLLSQKGNRENLVKILHYYELKSGKRWSFRDLFSLIAYILVGDYSELEISGKPVSPCTWAKKQVELINDSLRGSKDHERAPYLLFSRLYHHRLFPLWPRFESGIYKKAKQEILSGDLQDVGLQNANELFKYLAAAQSIAEKNNGDMPERIRNSLCQMLDPCIALGNEELYSRDGKSISITSIENAFSVSVREGLNTTESQLETLEKDLLKRLVLADESLGNDELIPRTKVKEAQLLQSTIRQLAARLVKRSLALKKGYCANSEQFTKYHALVKKPDSLLQIRKELKRLIQDNKGRFKAQLATTFGQPIAARSRDVSLILQSNISVSPVIQVTENGRPKDPILYLNIEGHYVGLTFDLFSSLDEISRGLTLSSLSSDIYTLLDRVKSLVSGKAVRDKEVLNDEPIIMIGESELEIEFINQKFSVNKGRNQ